MLSTVPLLNLLFTRVTARVFRYILARLQPPRGTTTLTYGDTCRSSSDFDDLSPRTPSSCLFALHRVGDNFSDRSFGSDSSRPVKTDRAGDSLDDPEVWSDQRPFSDMGAHSGSSWGSIDVQGILSPRDAPIPHAYCSFARYSDEGTSDNPPTVAEPAVGGRGPYSTWNTVPYVEDPIVQRSLWLDNDGHLADDMEETYVAEQFPYPIPQIFGDAKNYSEQFGSATMMDSSFSAEWEALIREIDRFRNKWFLPKPQIAEHWIAKRAIRLTASTEWEAIEREIEEYRREFVAAEIDPLANEITETSPEHRPSPQSSSPLEHIPVNLTNLSAPVHEFAEEEINPDADETADSTSEHTSVQQSVSSSTNSLANVTNLSASEQGVGDGPLGLYAINGEGSSKGYVTSDCEEDTAPIKCGLSRFIRRPCRWVCARALLRRRRRH